MNSFDIVVDNVAQTRSFATREEAEKAASSLRSSSPSASVTVREHAASQAAGAARTAGAPPAADAPPHGALLQPPAIAGAQGTSNTK